MSYLFVILALAFLGLILLALLGLALFYIFRPAPESDLSAPPPPSRERIRIERMRDEGSISEEEADKLLQALGPETSDARNREPDAHLRTAAILLTVCGVLLLCAAGLHTLTVSSFGETMEEFSTGDGSVEGMVTRFTWMGVVIVSISALGAILSLASGIGLLRASSPAGLVRARRAGILFAAFSLIAFPIGTLIGAYLLWVLQLRADADRYFHS